MGPLSGYIILIVEDEPLVAVGVGAALADAGAEIVTAHNLASALEAALNGSFSAAILDVALGAADTGAVCTALKSRQVPFIFLTGFDTHRLLREWASVPALAKPMREAELVANVEALLTCS